MARRTASVDHRTDQVGLLEGRLLEWAGRRYVDNSWQTVRWIEPDNEREAWLNLSIQGLEGAYGEDEPGYSTDLIKEVNPHFKL